MDYYAQNGWTWEMLERAEMLPAMHRDDWHERRHHGDLADPAKRRMPWE